MDFRLTFRPPRLFIDTGALVAVYDTSDALHSVATQFRDDILLPYQVDMLSSYYVIAETLNNLQRRLSARRMRKSEFDRAADELILSTFLANLEINDDVNRRALEIVNKFPRHFSFTDATSLALMERERIRHVFSFDHKFEWYPLRAGHTNVFLTRHPSSVPLVV